MSSAQLLTRSTTTRAPLRVMIVDDSATVRTCLRLALEHTGNVVVVAEAADPFAARAPFRDTLPDALVVDVVMPGMDGLAFVRKVMSLRPTPVVVFTSQADYDAQALASGACACIRKPSGIGTDTMTACAIDIIAALQRVRRTDAALASIIAPVIAIGASTGGPDAVARIVERLPGALPPVLIAVHMPASFTAAFAHRLGQLGPLKVVQAESGMALESGMAVVAPGDRHLMLGGHPGHWVAMLDDQPPRRHHKPSVDVLFDSVARLAAPHACGVLLTGMGDDGADGLLAMRQGGCATVAQDEASSVVFGMPAEAIRRGAATTVLPLDDIPLHLVHWATHAPAEI